MEKKETILHSVGRSLGGATLPHFKGTAEFDTVIMPPPKSVAIPLQQHIGVPCEPTVKAGDKVYVGTKIGDSEKLICAPVHSSVSGTVTKIADVIPANGKPVKMVFIESDGLMEPDPNIAPITVETEEDLVKAARECGLVGLGGAGFPTHVKLTKRQGVELDTLIINGAECEPYITADYRECMENTEDILYGIYLVKRILGLKKVIIGVEDNKPKALQKLSEIASEKYDAEDEVKVMRLKSRYPQGAEKVLIYSATKRKLPLGKLPSDVGCIVMNITSISALSKYIRTGMPLVTKRITVDGDAIKNPCNIIVPIGTSAEEILEFCGGFTEEPDKIVLGGPMMGNAIVSTDVVIAKPNNAILCFKEKKPLVSTACIKCGRCIGACPMNLTPAAVEAKVSRKKLDADFFSKMNVSYCMECGCCSFVCPARRELVQAMRIAKNEMRRNSK